MKPATTLLVGMLFALINGVRAADLLSLSTESSAQL
jgi:hypothetical protein